MVGYAALVARHHPDAASTELARNLRASDPRKVAEICAALLLRQVEEN
jgi:hypothetical protein